MNACSAPIGQWLKIKTVDGSPVFRKRLMELGLLPGEQIYIERRLPWSGPCIVRIGTSTMALRKEEALCLTLE